MIPEARIRQKSAFTLVWIAPIVALFITIGMIGKTYMNMGTRISIVLDNGVGIQNGKTPIMYKGTKIGIVEDVHIKADDVSKIELIALIDKEASAGVTRKGNKFWKVEPKISMTEISGLSTIVSGVYISVMPAATTSEALNRLAYQDHFIALDSAPVDVFNPGLSVIVTTADKGDISIGAPVLYNKQEIGHVEHKRLSDDKKRIELCLRINSAYVDLVREKSIFYKADALDIKASMSGITVNMGSLASLIAGGIGMSNSKESLSSPLAKERMTFKLYNNHDELFLSKEKIVLVMKAPHKLEAGISKIFFKGIEAGLVSSLKYDPAKDQTNVGIKLNKNFSGFANEKAYFWIVKPKLDFEGFSGLDTIVSGNYINFITSKIDAKSKNNFVLYDKAPQGRGVLVYLYTDDIQDIKEGTGIFYHGVKIGKVSSYKIKEDKKSFSVKLLIKPQYAKLINYSSEFYHQSGIDIKADLEGLDVTSASLETLLRGGIAVQTSDFSADKKLKKEYRLYTDYAKLKKAEYLAKKGLRLTLLADELGSLKKGSPVYYKQIRVGEILSYRWDTQTRQLLIDLYIEEKYAAELKENTLFYNAGGVQAKFDLNGLKIDIETVQTLISGGISFYTPSSLTSKYARNNDRFELYRSKEKAMGNYLDFTIFSQNAGGLQEGSPLEYKNIRLGHIETIELVGDKVQLNMKIQSKYKDLINKETIFWLEGFHLGLDGIKNPSAVFKGPSIVLKPGLTDECAYSFNLNLQGPVPHLNEKGLRISLDAPRLGGLKADTPVYFRQIKIGSVVQYSLKDDARAVKIDLFIEPCYAHLIRKNSYFFNASGIGMDINLFGAKMKTESLESMMTGAIGVLTPYEYEEEAKEADTFKLHETFDEDALAWAPELHSTDKACK